jgi:hypothetical protein
MMNLQEGLAEIAEGYIGVHEEPRGSNRGPKLREFFSADNYTPNVTDDGYPWCSAFVCRCAQVFLSERKKLFPIIRPTTPAAFGLVTWGFENGCFIFHPTAGKPHFVPDARPQRGDIVVYQFSHCGIVAAQAVRGRNFTAVEGNTNKDGGRDGYEVAARPRTWSDARAFIRLTPRATPA